MLTLYTDGLIEKPGLDLGDAIAALAARFTPAPSQPLPSLAESLIQPAANEQRTDDTALLLGLTTLWAATTLDNAGSRAVLARTGFVPVGETVLDGRPGLRYERHLEPSSRAGHDRGV